MVGQRVLLLHLLDLQEARPPLLPLYAHVPHMALNGH